MANDLVSIGALLLFVSLAASPFAILVFRPRVMGGGFIGNVWRMFQDYWIHFALFGVGYFLVVLVEGLNDPLRGVFGDFTYLLWAIEGDASLYVQRAFESPSLTAVLNINYLFGYIFISYFSVLLAAYADDRVLANKLALSYLVIYVISVPFYMFFNVQVTSDYIPGMKALLYHSSEAYLIFFARADPLDNAFPSLHMGIPYGLFLLMWWTMRSRGRTMGDWGYRHFLWLVIVELFVFGFSIIYLGIHWITDIPGGLIIGLMGATVVEAVHDRFFKSAYGFADVVHQRLRRWFGRVAPGRPR